MTFKSGLSDDRCYGGREKLQKPDEEEPDLVEI